MEGQNQTQNEETPKGKGSAVKDSIKKLKDKFVPGVKYTLLISAAFNFAMLVVGCINVHKCTVNKNIPLFLIAIGAIGLVSKFVSYVRDRILKHVQVMYIESALYSVEMIFFFLGTYWVYKEFQPSYTPGDPNYCNKTAYLFAFVYLTVYYALLITFLLGFCCFLCCIVCIVTTSSSQDVESQTANTEAAERLTKHEQGESKP